MPEEKQLSAGSQFFAGILLIAFTALGLTPEESCCCPRG
jgi:hypothetical protein